MSNALEGLYLGIPDPRQVTQEVKRRIEAALLFLEKMNIFLVKQIHPEGFEKREILAQISFNMETANELQNFYKMSEVPYVCGLETIKYSAWKCAFHPQEIEHSVYYTNISLKKRILNNVC